MDKFAVARVDFDNGYHLTLSSHSFPFTIGRDPRNDLCVDVELVSRSHCRIDVINDKLQLIDESTNGTLADDKWIHQDSIDITQRTCLLFAGDQMITITPCDARGRIRQSKNQLENPNELNGICIVDICDSTEKDSAVINSACQKLREAIQRKDNQHRLLLKHTGDGFLAVYGSTLPALRAAKRLLKYQSQEGSIQGLDIRVTLDAGATLPTHDKKDRLGLVINRASRLEKIQSSDIEEPGTLIADLKPRNRCILSQPFRNSLGDNRQSQCEFMGSTRLKGFGDTMHSVYQLVT